jgi:hypothetical protein
LLSRCNQRNKKNFKLAVFGVQVPALLIENALFWHVSNRKALLGKDLQDTQWGFYSMMS